MTARRISLTMSLLLTVALTSATAAERFSFGIVPQQAASQLAQGWAPVLSYLSAEAGITLAFATAPDIPTFESRLSQGQYDFAYMNPYHYTVFHKKPGYAAIAKERNKQIEGIIVVRSDSPIQSVRELDGKDMAFPSPAAFAATILPLAELKRQGISVIPRFVSSHDSVYLNVVRGLASAGGGIKRTLSVFDPAQAGQIRVLSTTTPYTPHAIAAHPRVPVEILSRVTAAMMHLDADPAAKPLLDTLGFNGIEPASDADWDDVRALEIDLL